MVDNAQESDQATSQGNGEQTILAFDQFQGINTLTTRPGVPDAQTAWLDGFMPVAPYNLRTMYGVGATLYTAAPNTILFFYPVNLFLPSGTLKQYHIVFFTNGSVGAVDIALGGETPLLPPGTIASPSQQNIGVTQWNEQYILITSTGAAAGNGYWVWDGTTIYGPGTLAPGVTITNGGSSYGPAPYVFASGGHGSGATFTATVSGGSVSSITMTNPGSGYIGGDVVTLVIQPPTASGSGANITVNMTFNGSFWFVSSVNLISGGSGYSAGATATVAGGLAINPATLGLTVTGGVITGVTITFQGIYTGNVPAPTVHVTDAAVQATATVSLMPLGLAGTTIETYQSRVWIANGPSVSYSAPGTVFNFGSDGAGSFTSGSSVLRFRYTRLLSTNGFLYMIADSSVDYISGVQTTASPPITTFTLQNADPEVGSPYPYGVTTFGSQIVFPNAYGVHAMYGAAATKISEMLDGVYNTVLNFGGLVLSSCEAIIFGRKVWVLLTEIVDPVNTNVTLKLFIWDGKRWWASVQDKFPIYIKHQELNSQITAWATDGTNIYPMFTNPTGGFVKVAQSKLWDRPGGYQTEKANARFWLLGKLASLVNPSVQVLIDNVDANSNTTEVTLTLTPTQTGYYAAPPQGIGQQGVLTGMTLITSAADFQLISASMDADLISYRG